MFWPGFWSAYARVYDSLCQLDPYRELVRDLVDRIAPRSQQHILDAGCGTGQVTRAVQDRCPTARLIGVDASPAMLKRAAGRGRWAELAQVDLDGPLPFPEEWFDAIVSSNVLYSLPRPGFTLGELSRVMKPGGRLVLATPASEFRLGALIGDQLARGWRQRVRFLSLLPSLCLVLLFNFAILSRARERTYHFFGPEELRGLLEASGFEPVELGRTYADQDWLVLALKR